MLGHGALETPWKPLPIDTDLADALAEETPYLRETGEQIHAAEHSLELQLPFLAHVLPGIPVVPILMGEQTRSRRICRRRCDRGGRARQGCRASSQAATCPTTTTP